MKAQTLRTQMAKNILEVTKVYTIRLYRVKVVHVDASSRVIQQQCDQLLADHDAAVATDILHEIILEGRAKKQMRQHQNAKDVWTSNLDPRVAVHARTVPVLESERDRMLSELDKVILLGNDWQSRSVEITT